MHYYKRNIGDYYKKTGRLSMLQHGAYTLLMDACYDRECFPTRDEAIEWCWAETEDQVAAVDVVLKRFFKLVDGRYEQGRVVEELDEYRQLAEKNRENGKLGGRPKKPKKTQVVTTGIPLESQNNPNKSESNPNQEPLTTNHKPVTIKPTCTEQQADSMPAVLVNVFCEIPRNDGTTHPITDEMITKWQSLYPAINVQQELRNMIGWCDAKPQNRKTARGMNAFINGWLAREQNRGPKHEGNKQLPFQSAADRKHAAILETTDYERAINF